MHATLAVSNVRQNQNDLYFMFPSPKSQGGQSEDCFAMHILKACIFLIFINIYLIYNQLYKTNSFLYIIYLVTTTLTKIEKISRTPEDF